jgi:hypothetical protein
LGGFATNYACTPLFFELGSELAYPVGEAVVAGLMTCGWCFVGIIFLSVFFINNIGKIGSHFYDLFFTFFHS